MHYGMLSLLSSLAVRDSCIKYSESFQTSTELRRLQNIRYITETVCAVTLPAKNRVPCSLPVAIRVAGITLIFKAMSFIIITHSHTSGLPLVYLQIYQT